MMRIVRISLSAPHNTFNAKSKAATAGDLFFGAAMAGLAFFSFLTLFALLILFPFGLNKLLIFSFILSSRKGYRLFTREDYQIKNAAKKAGTGIFPKSYYNYSTKFRIVIPACKTRIAIASNCFLCYNDDNLMAVRRQARTEQLQAGMMVA